MKIDLVFLLKAIKENENIYIYHKEGKRTLRYFSRFFQSAFIKELNSRDLQDLANNKHSPPVFRSYARDYYNKKK